MRRRGAAEQRGDTISHSGVAGVAYSAGCCWLCPLLLLLLSDVTAAGDTAQECLAEREQEEELGQLVKLQPAGGLDAVRTSDPFLKSTRTPPLTLLFLVQRLNSTDSCQDVDAIERTDQGSSCLQNCS